MSHFMHFLNLLKLNLNESPPRSGLFYMRWASQMVAELTGCDIFGAFSFELLHVVVHSLVTTI